MDEILKLCKFCKKTVHHHILYKDSKFPIAVCSKCLTVQAEPPIKNLEGHKDEH